MIKKTAKYFGLTAVYQYGQVSDSSGWFFEAVVIVTCPSSLSGQPANFPGLLFYKVREAASPPPAPFKSESESESGSQTQSLSNADFESRSRFFAMSHRLSISLNINF
jgi:hypothetical protein